jgi:hypothetical protein
VKAPLRRVGAAMFVNFACGGVLYGWAAISSSLLPSISGRFQFCMKTFQCRMVRLADSWRYCVLCLR